MNTYYKVESTFMDCGEEYVIVSTIKSDKKPRNRQYREERYDFYLDYFKTLEEVKIFLIDCENVIYKI